MIARRSLLAGILGAAVAPAIITRPGILMPVRKIVVPGSWWISEMTAVGNMIRTRDDLFDCARFAHFPGTMVLLGFSNEPIICSPISRHISWPYGGGASS